MKGKEVSGKLINAEALDLCRAVRKREEGRTTEYEVVRWSGSINSFLSLLP
jgi:hypothetical protein